MNVSSFIYHRIFKWTPSYYVLYAIVLDAQCFVGSIWYKQLYEYLSVGFCFNIFCDKCVTEEFKNGYDQDEQQH